VTWIDVNERLPEAGAAVLAYVPVTVLGQPHQWVVRFIPCLNPEVAARLGVPGHAWQLPMGGHWQADQVTHWTPLPSPPQEAA